MSFIDQILNLAGLLIWFNYRSRRFDPLEKRRPATLIGTLRPADAARARTWLVLLSLPGLLLFRAILYWQIGAPADWVPRLDLGAVVLAFRVDRFTYALLFSLVSFLRLVAIAWVWLIALSLVTRKIADPDPLLRLIRLQLGRMARAPIYLQVLAPAVAIVLVWAGLHPLLDRADVLGPARSAGQIAVQGLLVALGTITTLKLLFPLILLVYMLSSYVYLGTNPFWDFISNTSRSLLAWMPWRSLRSSRLDFAPLAAIVLILLALHTGPMLALRFAASQGLTIWPE